jgi:uncharacterized protein
MADLTDNTARHRYELEVDGHVAFVSYARSEERLKLVHTEVPRALAGRGVGSRLARLVLEEARRRRGVRVVPECPFMASFIERHQEFADLIATPAVE